MQEVYSLYELESNHFFQENPSGTHIWTKQFQNGWIYNGTNSYKIDSISIEYQRPDPIENNFSVNFGNHVLAVMEYVNKHEKVFVTKEGEQKYREPL
jgi:hypothetical protein